MRWQYKQCLPEDRRGLWSGVCCWRSGSTPPSTWTRRNQAVRLSNSNQDDWNRGAVKAGVHCTGQGMKFSRDSLGARGKSDKPQTLKTTKNSTIYGFWKPIDVNPIEIVPEVDEKLFPLTVSLRGIVVDTIEWGRVPRPPIFFHYVASIISEHYQRRLEIQGVSKSG